MNKIYGRKGGKSTEIPPNYNQSTLLILRFDNPEFPQSPDLAHGKYTSTHLLVLNCIKDLSYHKIIKTKKILT